METKPDHQDSGQDRQRERPSFALVQHGAVIAHFGPDEAETASSAAYRMTEIEGHHVEVYEIDRGLPPPVLGSRVDPKALGWVEVDEA